LTKKPQKTFPSIAGSREINHLAYNQPKNAGLKTCVFWLGKKLEQYLG
jgi:hypothetical protein